MGEPSARETVEGFFKDWETGFVAAFEKWMAPDVVWQNTGLPDRVGYDDVMDQLRQYNEISQMPYGRVEMINIMAEGDTVLTERIDHLWDDDGRTHAAKIMGALQVRNGKITRYSDYLDVRQFEPEKYQ
ncbi:MAG: nuclear transport factor 2 family protein [Blastomonas sp.]